ncbi:Phytochrome-like protein cph2 [compost metagenome]
MNIPVVAEGVEDQAQLEYLRSQGCDYGQGYLFSKPLPLDRLIRLVLSRKAVAPTLDPAAAA